MNRTTWITWAVALLVAWIVGWSLIAVLVWKRDIAFPQATSDVGDYTVRFGILGADSSGNDYLSEETTTIPLKYKDSGFRYGWEVVAPDNSPFNVRCVVHFSAALKVITGEAFDSTTPSNIMSTSTQQVTGSFIQDFWFDPGDSIGDESVDIFVNDKLVKTIKYTVIQSS
jgi:hypothetical protein